MKILGYEANYERPLRSLQRMLCDLNFLKISWLTFHSIRKSYKQQNRTICSTKGVRLDIDATMQYNLKTKVKIANLLYEEMFYLTELHEGKPTNMSDIQVECTCEVYFFSL